MAQNLRRINLRFTPECHGKLDERRSRWRLSFQELGARLFHGWLTGESDVPSHAMLRKPAEPLLEQAAMLQAHGDKDLLAFLNNGGSYVFGHAVLHDAGRTCSPQGCRLRRSAAPALRASRELHRVEPGPRQTSTGETAGTLRPGPSPHQQTFYRGRRIRCSGVPAGASS
jgi:hypothetical protein